MRLCLRKWRWISWVLCLDQLPPLLSKSYSLVYLSDHQLHSRVANLLLSSIRTTQTLTLDLFQASLSPYKWRIVERGVWPWPNPVWHFQPTEHIYSMSLYCKVKSRVGSFTAALLLFKATGFPRGRIVNRSLLPSTLWSQWPQRSMVTRLGHRSQCFPHQPRCEFLTFLFVLFLIKVPNIVRDANIVIKVLLN